jgi:hypothetical protein
VILTWLPVLFVASRLSVAPSWRPTYPQRDTSSDWFWTSLVSHFILLLVLRRPGASVMMIIQIYKLYVLTALNRRYLKRNRCLNALRRPFFSGPFRASVAELFCLLGLSCFRRRAVEQTELRILPGAAQSVPQGPSWLKSCNSWLACLLADHGAVLFLLRVGDPQVHAELLARDKSLLDKVAALAALQKQVWRKLEGYFHSSLCLVGHFSKTQQ